jgi:hypothetical protein
MTRSILRNNGKYSKDSTCFPTVSTRDKNATENGYLVTKHYELDQKFLIYSNIFQHGYGTIFLDQHGCLLVHISSLQASAES